MTKIQLLHWSLGTYLVLGIFYVFPPGGPQPADFFMLIILTIAIFNEFVEIKRPDIPLVIFVGYALVVSSAWTAILMDFKLYLGGIYLCYNALVYFMFQKYQMISRNYRRSLLIFTMAGLFIEVTYIIFIENINVRAIGTFTNPNQLSYFGLCFTSLGLMIANNERKVAAGILILVMGWIISLFGLSKAAMIAMAFQTVIFGVLLEKRRGLFFVLGAIAAGIVFIFSEQQITSALARISTIGEDSDDSIAARGYDRILNDFEYVILGAGEGQYKRHDSVWGGEIHSSFGTIIFSYGIFGSVMFLMFLANIWRRNRFGFVIYILPLMIYSLTHNGLRYTPFWICLAVCSQLGFQRRKAWHQEISPDVMARA